MKKQIFKSFPLVGGAEAYVNMQTGKGKIIVPDISDSQMGVRISHVIDGGEDDLNCGSGARLNLHETLVKEENGYIYTDGMGEKHTVTEIFYYIDENGEKQVITDKSLIVIDPNGMMSYSNGTYNVYREEKTDNGFKVTTTLDGVSNIENYEQRADEQKQLEEQIKAYENAILDFVVADENGVIKSNCTTVNDVIEAEKSKETNEYCLTKSEALNFESLTKQLSALDYVFDENGELKSTQNENQRKIIQEQLDYYLLGNIDAIRRAEFWNAYCEYDSASVHKYNSIDDYIVVNKEGKCYSGNDPACDHYGEDGSKLYTMTVGEAIQIEAVNKFFNNSEIENGAKGYFEQLHNRRQYEVQNLEELKIKDVCFNKLIDYVLLNEEGEIISQLNWSSANDMSKEDIEALYNNQQSYMFTKSDVLQINALKSQLDLLETQDRLGKEQYLFIKNQKDELLNTHEKNIDLLKTYNKEYCLAKSKLDTLKLQIPVCFISNENSVKGFNAEGDLVVIYGKNNNYVAIDYEQYYSEGIIKNRIARLYNEKEQQIKLSYDKATEMLTEIVNSKGENVRFNYNFEENGRIDENEVALFNSNDISVSVATNSNSKSFYIRHKRKVSYVDFVNSKCILIRNLARFNSVSHNQIDETETLHIIDSNIISYNDNLTTVKDMLANKQTYLFADNHCTEQREISSNKVISAAKYEYTGNNLTKVIYPKKSCLYVSNDDFIFVEDYSKTIEYDEFDRITSETEGWITVSGTVKKQAVTSYTYDSSDRAVKVYTVVSTKKNDSLLSETENYVQLFEYNQNGQLLCKKSYKEGSELIEGISIEEHIYNKNGYEIKSFTYNSLDPSSKLYKEYEIDENGKVTGEFDQSGINKIVYKDNSAIHPNGSIHSCGVSAHDGNSAITMSTENDEENSIQKLYTNGYLTRVISGDNVYDYTYDYKGRKTSVSINGQLHISYSYEDEATENDKTVNKTIATYVNGDKVTVTEDLLGNVLSVNKRPYDYDTLVAENRTRILDPNASQIELNITNEYDVKNRVIKKMDSSVNDCVFSEYEYDEQDRVTSYSREATFGDSLPYSEEYSYNTHGNVTERTVDFNSTRTDTTTYEYDENTQKLTAINCAGATRIEPKVDCLGRNRGKTISWNGTKIYSEDITYLKHGDHTTIMPLTISYGNNTENGFVVKDRIKYKYDEMGNICEAYENGQFVTEYKYDALGRLVRENNKKLDKTLVFSYDNKGNILTRIEYAFTLKDDDFIKEATGEVFEYVYSGEKLVSYNGEIFTYDDVGNPTTYRGNTLTWRFGRRLTSFGANTFDYNAEGKRIKKNDISYIYDSQGRLFAQSNGFEFFYDENSSPIAFAYLGEVYYYKKDLLGNVIEILDTNGNTMVKYTYDAWGNHTVIDYTEFGLGNINPFRYRGYYYDTETGLYYLKSRYYDPQTGRFISMDGISYLDPEIIGGANLYAYCLNNPVMMIDETGCDPAWWQWILAGIAIAGAITISVLIMGTATPVLAGMLIGGAVSVGFEIGSQIIFDGGIHDTGAILSVMLGGMVAGAISGIPMFGGFTPRDYIGIAILGGVASVVGGVVSGGVHDVNSFLIALSLGALGNVAAKAVNHLVVNRIAGKIMNSSSAKSRSLAINNYMIKHNVKPMGFGHSTFGGWSRNLFKNMSKEFFKTVVADTTSRSAIVYSALISSAISGWY